MKTGSAIAESPPIMDRYLNRAPQVAFYLFSGSLAALMAAVWLSRDARYIQAESGLGYGLGIAGATMMLILLFYPMRKRLQALQGMGTLSAWFRLHMLLGVLGPCMILLHSNFRLGSTNSTVALTAMLLVAGSGLIGRYFYGKFHYGLYGEQVKLRQLRRDLDSVYTAIKDEASAPEEDSSLLRFYEGCMEVIDSQQRNLSLGELLQHRSWLRQQSRQFKVAAAQHPRTAQDYRTLAALLNRLAGLRLFERLFNLWHVVHIPVFLLMIITASVHVFVVHWY